MMRQAGTTRWWQETKSIGVAPWQDCLLSRHELESECLRGKLPAEGGVMYTFTDAVLVCVCARLVGEGVFS